MALLAEVVRSGYVEGWHSGAVLAVRADGTTAFSLGQVERPWFPRSANKPFQAAAMLDLGWQPEDERQVALAAGSHWGEPGHLAVLETMYPDLSALACPPDLPLSPEAARTAQGPSREAMNCSGKHAAMLATCVVNGWPTDGYLDPTHPLQVALLSAIEEYAGEPVRHVAVDGCGAPQHALTLPGLARGYRRLATDGGSLGRVAAALRAHPWYAGGTGFHATRLIQGVPGLVVKDGADGVYAGALPDGAAVAVKVYDGADRARVPALVAALRLLGAEAPVLDELATTAVLGGGLPVGEVRVAGTLTAATAR